MEIPYTVRPRPDTGLTNPKLGIWLFLASEVMLFGGLFAGYIFMRLGAEPWMWPHGWLNVPVGTFNTFILIASSVTIILSWECLKMRKYKAYKAWLMATWLCGFAFLGVKLMVEWPDKFHHFGAYVQKDSLHKYEALLGNEDPVDEKGQPLKNEKGEVIQGRFTRKLSERRFISGHLAFDEKKGETLSTVMHRASVPYLAPVQLDNMIGSIWTLDNQINDLPKALTEAKAKVGPAEAKYQAAKKATSGLSKAAAAEDKALLAATAEYNAAREKVRSLEHQLSVATATKASLGTLLTTTYGFEPEDSKQLLNPSLPAEKQKELRKAFLHKVNFINVHSVDGYNAEKYSPEYDGPRFELRPKLFDIDAVKDLPAGLVHEEGGHKHLVLNKADLLEKHGPFVPKLNTYLACYFMITGLHGAHVLGGCLVFIYFWLNIKGGSKLYHTNHQQLCNRIEVAGLFWHLVDLIWIFVFPIFYLL